MKEVTDLTKLLEEWRTAEQSVAEVSKDTRRALRNYHPPDVGMNVSPERARAIIEKITQKGELNDENCR